MKQSIARKELSRVEENGKETIVNDIIHFDFDEGILCLLEEIFDDWEYASNHGINMLEDGETQIIDVDQALDELEDRIMGDETPDKEDTQREHTIKEYLEDYRGYTIWI